MSLLLLAACQGGDDSSPPASNPPTQTTTKPPTSGGGSHPDDPDASGPSSPDPTGPTGPDPTGPTGPEPTGPTGPEPTGPTGPEATTLRVVAANLTSGDDQAYSEHEGADILRALHGDVVLLQEFRYGDNSAGDINAFVVNTFGADVFYIRETGYDLPNGIVSRYPIVEGGSWDSPKAPNRGFAWARIDIPGPTDLWAISVHLLTASSSIRNDEAKALLADLDDVVPTGDFIVIGGDYNTDTRTEPCLTTFSARFKTTSPYPADTKNNGNTNAARAKPYDWVLSSSTFAPREIPVIMASHTFANGLVVDTRTYLPLADLAPAQTTDSGATNMQHMAVVKDYSLAP